jgi:hypothetical protein
MALLCLDASNEKAITVGTLFLTICVTLLSTVDKEYLILETTWFCSERHVINNQKFSVILVANLLGTLLIGYDGRGGVEEEVKNHDNDCHAV